MLPPKTRWSVGNPDPAIVRELAESLHIRPLLAALLAARGHTAEEAAFFLSDHNTFHDPYLLIDMEKAVERIRSALANREKILVYGDYDADGVSSTSLMVRLLKMVDADYSFRIPHRVHDGYGLHTHYLEQAKRDGVTLVITVDTGITAVAEAEAAAMLGIDLIVTDHHEPPETLPKAYAIVNPKRADCTYPFKGLAGVGVAFKLAQALLGRVPEELAEWAALGTIADLMPLVGENRSIVKTGLKRLRTMPSTGFQALYRICSLQAGEVTEGSIGFAIAPRINAVGRLDSAVDAVKLMVTDDGVEADEIARRLDALNKERQKLVEEASAEARALVEAAGGAPDAIVVASERWSPGIIGIVASRLVEAYYRPTVVIAIDPETGKGKGSARAIAGFHLYDALKTCEHLFDHFGGHESAAGLSLPQERLQEFIEAFQAEASRRLTDELKIPVTKADAELSIADVTLEAIAELDKLAPYGMAHPAPRFALRDTIVREASVIGKDRRHAKFRITDGRRDLDAVGFGIGESVRRIADGSRLSFIGELSVNEWNGRRTPQVIVKDVTVPHVQLFDWRDCTSAAIFRKRWEEAAAGEWKPAFVLGAYDEPPPTLAPYWAEVPAYRLQPNGEDTAYRLQPNGEDTGEHVGAVAANEAARSSGRKLSSFTDLFLTGCPFPLDRFHHILKGGTVRRLYALHVGNYEQDGSIVDREIMKKVYIALRELQEGTESDWIRVLSRKLGLGSEAIRLAVHIFRELGFVERSEGEAGTALLRVVSQPAKRDLTESMLFSQELIAAKARLAWKQSSIDALRERLLGGSEQEHQELTNMKMKTEAIG